ncbi:MAG: head GIN domain-containing protein [Anaerolineaceae bacterium]|nr:head GIN domain-containing protein [Anaerolineaceae bacterium]
MKKVYWLALTVVMLATMACGVSSVPFTGQGERVDGSGERITESRQVSGFDQVILAASGNVDIQVGEEEALTIEADDNIMPYLTSEVKGDTLVLGQTPNLLIHLEQPAHYTLTVKQLEGIEVSGSGIVSLDGLETQEMHAKVTGSGNIYLHDLLAESLEAVISGSGVISLDGRAENGKVQINGSGSFQGADFETQEMDVRISGSGSAQVRALEKLDISIPGSGNVTYSGSPRVSQSITGSGKITSSGE